MSENVGGRCDVIVFYLTQVNREREVQLAGLHVQRYLQQLLPPTHPAPPPAPRPPRCRRGPWCAERSPRHRCGSRCAAHHRRRHQGKLATCVSALPQCFPHHRARPPSVLVTMRIARQSQLEVEQNASGRHVVGDDGVPARVRWATAQPPTRADRSPSVRQANGTYAQVPAAVSCDG